MKREIRVFPPLGNPPVVYPPQAQCDMLVLISHSYYLWWFSLTSISRVWAARGQGPYPVDKFYPQDLEWSIVQADNNVCWLNDQMNCWFLKSKSFLKFCALFLTCPLPQHPNCNKIFLFCCFLQGVMEITWTIWQQSLTHPSPSSLAPASAPLQKRHW